MTTKVPNLPTSRGSRKQCLDWFQYGQKIGSRTIAAQSMIMRSSIPRAIIQKALLGSGNGLDPIPNVSSDQARLLHAGYIGCIHHRVLRRYGITTKMVDDWLGRPDFVAVI